MNVADTVKIPTHEEVIIYALPGLTDPSIVPIPVFHAVWGVEYRGYRWQEFGVPFMIVLSQAEARDYNAIYEKIRRKYAQFSPGIKGCFGWRGRG